MTSKSTDFGTRAEINVAYDALVLTLSEKTRFHSDEIVVLNSEIVTLKDERLKFLERISKLESDSAHKVSLETKFHALVSELADLRKSSSDSDIQHSSMFSALQHDLAAAEKRAKMTQEAFDTIQSLSKRVASMYDQIVADNKALHATASTTTSELASQKQRIHQLLSEVDLESKKRSDLERELILTRDAIPTSTPPLIDLEELEELRVDKLRDDIKIASLTSDLNSSFSRLAELQINLEEQVEAKQLLQGPGDAVGG